MSSTILPMILLCAHITGLISVQLLNATVGGSVLIPCSLPGHPLSLNWFYWQEGEQHFFQWEGGKIIPVEDNKYKDRFQVFNSEFSSGNISIGLDNISAEDDQKTFFAIAKIGTKLPQQQCRSTLQVSAPYQDLVLTVNNTANSATCRARGGYPEAQVSWKGLNRSNNQQLDLQGAQTSLQQDPTEKTFSFISSVNVTGLKSVTCVAYNPHESINRTVEIDAAADTLNQTPGDSTPSQNKDGNKSLAAIIVPVVLIPVLAGVPAVVFVLYRRQHPDPDPAQVQAQAEAGNGSEGAVSLTETGAEYRRLNTNTNDIAAAAPEEKEKLLKKENGNEENSKRHSEYENMHPNWQGNTEA